MHGVFFRQSTLEEAKKLGLKGTVQNLPDGSVEIHAEGDEKKLEELIVWCKNGPQHATVDGVKFFKEEVQDYPDFRII